MMVPLIDLILIELGLDTIPSPDVIWALRFQFALWHFFNIDTNE